MRKHTLFPALLLSVLMFTILACNKGKEPAPTKEEEVLPQDIVELRDDQAKLAKIETGTIEKRTLNGTLKVSGIIAVAPQNMATVCMPLGGFVKSITVAPGTSVSKGQTLAILENQEFVDIQQNYLETKNKLEFAEADFVRHSELYKNDVYSQQNIQQVTADYKNLKAQARALEQKLAMIGINPSTLNEDNITRAVAVSAPISGFIKAVNINIGKFVAPTEVLFEIVNSDKLLLELTLFEKDADKVSTGQKIRFFINNETEQHEAIIYQTGRSVNADRTYKVYASVSGICRNVIPGMYVNAVIEASGIEVTALPSEAIVSFDDKDYIFAFGRNKTEGGKPFTEYRMIEVHRGVTDGGYSEITFPEGFDIKTARIVIKGAYSLLSAKKNAGEMSC